MVNQTIPQHKLIIVEDIGRDLNPIGYGFKSPILSPFKAPIDIVRRLFGESMVTNMYEVYEKDHTMRVKLTRHNFRKPFVEIWKEENPNSEFPWTTGVTDIPTTITQPKEQDKVKSNDQTVSKDHQVDNSEEISSDEEISSESDITVSIGNIVSNVEVTIEPVKDISRPIGKVVSENNRKPSSFRRK